MSRNQRIGTAVGALLVIGASVLIRLGGIAFSLSQGFSDWAKTADRLASSFYQSVTGERGDLNSSAGGANFPAPRVTGSPQEIAAHELIKKPGQELGVGLAGSQSGSRSPAGSLNGDSDSGSEDDEGEDETETRNAKIGKHPARLGIDTSGDRAKLSILCSATNDCPFADEMIAALKKDVQTWVEKSYKGQQPDLNGGVDSSASIQVPICDRNGSFSAAETGTNHLGDRCGESVCKFHQQGGAEIDPLSCESERAWARGELIKEVKSALDQIVRELTVNRVLFVGPRCDGMARDPQYASVVQSYNQLNTDSASAKDGQPYTCDVSPDEAIENPEAQTGFYTNDRRISVQSGCYLNTVHSALWGSWAQQASCEVFARAELAWANHSLPQISSAISGAVSQAKASCGKSGDAYCLNQSYRTKIEKILDAPNRVANAKSDFTLSCPVSAKDCKCPDLLSCGSGSPYSRVELYSIRRAIESMDIAKKNLEILESLKSETKAVDIFSYFVQDRVSSPQTGWVSFSGALPSPSPSSSINGVLGP
jgi:hypothetical protein